MRSRRAAIWLKIGLWPAFGAALLPVVAALFHLMPAMAYAPASHHAAAHHDHHQHVAAGVEPTDATTEAVEEDCHPPGEPCDDPPRSMGMHCPLCMWLQGLHALPAPTAPALRLPVARIVAVQRYEAPLDHSFLQTTSQPRAPPISPTV